MSEAKHVVHVDELDWTERSRGKRLGSRRKQLGAAAGGRRLGCSLFEVPPGRRPFPYHWHTANEEAIYVLAGRGRLRLAGVEMPLSAGDYVACPVGEEGAHQVINDSDEPLRFLCVSEMIAPEIVVQPDSDKIGVIVGSPPGATEGRELFAWFRRGDSRTFNAEEL